MQATLDWQTQLAKKASQMQTSTKNVEQIFFEQAYIFIQNAAEPLMKPEFRIGFEVVYHNEDNTRLAGIFVFRVGETLLYAPVFYMNGQIRGHELLHRTDTKTFVMLDPDWCKYLIASYSVEPGQGASKTSLRDSYSRSSNLHKMVQPPGTYKQAATKFWGDLTASAANLSTESLTGEEKQAALRMRECIVDLGADAVEHIKRAAENNYRLDNNLYLAFDPDLYLPMEALEKKASTVTQAGLTIYPSPATNPLCKSASEADIRNGYKVVDTRLEKEAKIVVNGDTVAVTVTADQPQRVMYDDGKARDTYMLHTAYSLSDVVAVDAPRVESTRNPVVFEGGTLKRVRCDNDNATFIIDPGAEVQKLSEIASDTPKTDGRVYVYFPSTHRLISQPFKATKSGKTYQLFRSYDDEEVLPYGEPKAEYVFNPSSEVSDAASKIIGRDAMFIPAKGDSRDYLSALPLKGTDLRALLEKDAAYPVTSRLSSDGMGVVVKVAAQAPRRFSSIHGAALGLAHATGLGVDDAYDVFDGLADNRETRVYIKSARLHWDDVPDFLDSFDPSFGVPVDTPQEMTITSRYQEKEREVPRIGDKNEVTTGADIDALGGPAQLDAFAKQVGMRQIMAHGVIGSLLQEFDVGPTIDKYLPDLERGLDRLGRLLFLVYWKPDDFGRLFGMDDISAMESSISGAFKQQARLLLDLLQKAKEPKTSQVDAG